MMGIRRKVNKWFSSLRQPQGDISLFFEFKKPPYGGGNQFLMALRTEFARRGIKLDVNRIHSGTKAVLINSYNFDRAEFRKALMRSPGARVVHRIDGPVSKYRDGYSQEDEIVHGINQEFARVTVLQSKYSADANAEMGFRFKSPVIITNACDPKLFYPPKNPPDARNRIRVVASAWSSNANKGRSTYEWLDRNLDFSQFDLTFVGRTEGEFKNIRVVEPLPSLALGDLLRECHIYIAPSRNDPCSNALIEALSCGLPAVYLNSGGHAEIVKKAGLAFDDVEEIPMRLTSIARDIESYRRSISIPGIEEIATRYLEILQKS